MKSLDRQFSLKCFFGIHDYGNEKPLPLCKRCKIDIVRGGQDLP